MYSKKKTIREFAKRYGYTIASSEELYDEICDYVNISLKVVTLFGWKVWGVLLYVPLLQLNGIISRQNARRSIRLVVIPISSIRKSLRIPLRHKKLIQRLKSLSESLFASVRRHVNRHGCGAAAAAPFLF